MECKTMLGMIAITILGTLLLLALVGIEKKNNCKTKEELAKEEVRAILKVFPLWFLICNLLAISISFALNYFFLMWS